LTSASPNRVGSRPSGLGASTGICGAAIRYSGPVAGRYLTLGPATRTTAMPTPRATNESAAITGTGGRGGSAAGIAACRMPCLSGMPPCLSWPPCSGIAAAGTADSGRTVSIPCFRRCAPVTNSSDRRRRSPSAAPSTSQTRMPAWPVRQARQPPPAESSSSALCPPSAGSSTAARR
jgi:hypothetical protein